MHRGYVHLWRRTIDSKFFSMGLKHIGLFSYLLLKANWKTGWFMGEEIKPGQFATSITHLAETLHEHRHTVKKILQDLSDCSIISRQNMSNRWVMITICKWDSYQNPETFKNPTEVQPKSNQTPTECHENATIKSGKALEPGKSNTPPNPRRGLECPHEEMKKHWNSLCSQSGLQACRTAWPAKEAKARWADQWFREDWRAIMETAHRNTWCKDNHIGVLHVLRPNNAARYRDEYLSRKDSPAKARIVSILIEKNGEQRGMSFDTPEELAAFVKKNDLEFDSTRNTYRHRRQT